MAPTLATVLLAEGCEQKALPILRGVPGEHLDALALLAWHTVPEGADGHDILLLAPELHGPL
eukprot:8743635-Alexandrium_andersonii.AAC.1